MPDYIIEKWNTSKLSKEYIFEFTYTIKYTGEGPVVTMTIEYISEATSPPIMETYSFNKSNIVHFDLTVNPNVFINGYVRLVSSQSDKIAAWSDFHFGFEGYKHFQGIMLVFPEHLEK